MMLIISDKELEGPFTVLTNYVKFLTANTIMKIVHWNILMN